MRESGQGLRGTRCRHHAVSSCAALMGWGEEVKKCSGRDCSSAADVQQQLKRVLHDVHDVIQAIQEPKLLKEKVKQLYQKHCGEAVSSKEEDGDLERWV